MAGVCPPKAEQEDVLGDSGATPRGYVKENSPQGPGVISSFRGLAGISCYVLWVLQTATATLRLPLFSALIGETQALESPVAYALQFSKDWA